MRYRILILLFFGAFSIYSQIDSQSLFKLPILTNTEMNDPTTTADEGTLIYNSDSQSIYQYDGANWINLAPTTASKIFYPPSIAINADTISGDINAPGDETKDLYQEYLEQFSLTDNTTSAFSTNAPATIPIYLRTELYYYITYYDKNIFSNVNIDDNGVLTYDITNTPSDDNTIINVVFVVK